MLVVKGTGARSWVLRCQANGRRRDIESGARGLRSRWQSHGRRPSIPAASCAMASIPSPLDAGRRPHCSGCRRTRNLSQARRVAERQARRPMDGYAGDLRPFRSSGTWMSGRSGSTTSCQSFEPPWSEKAGNGKPAAATHQGRPRLCQRRRGCARVKSGPLARTSGSLFANPRRSRRSSTTPPSTGD